MDEAPMNFTMIVLITLLGLVCLTLGGLVTFLVLRIFGRKAEVRTITSSITERIRSVGKLTGLEVISKEIVTQTKGLNWLPPLLLSQARLAMIFHFEKQYYVDLSQLEADAVRRSGPNRFVIVLPAIEGNLNLHEVIPYDIQSGKLLGLLEVFKMDAAAQGEMMKRAQVEAAQLYEENAAKYECEARRAIARQVNGLLELFEVSVEVRFADDPTKAVSNATQQMVTGAAPQRMLPAAEADSESVGGAVGGEWRSPAEVGDKGSFWSSFGRSKQGVVGSA